MTLNTGSAGLKFTRIAAEHIPAAHDLSLEVKWPHRLDDWRFVERLGSGFVAEDAGGMVGTAMYWKHDARYASLGMVIVSPARQGHGIGKKLMTMVLDELEGRTVLLHATPSGQSLYARLGFVPYGAIDQHQGFVTDLPIISPAAGERLRPIGNSDGVKLAKLATQASGLSRAVVLPTLLEVADGIVLDRDGEAIGFALIRRFGRGYAIGPVVAPDAGRAQALIAHWISMRTRKFLRIDVPADCGLTGWLESRGLKHVDSVVAMARGAPPARDPALQVFAIINQALG